MLGNEHRMRLRAAALIVAAAVLMTAGPVLAQSPEQPRRSRGDGGLHVSGGGVVGYVGGSGSISGTVRGPGGSGSGNSPSGDVSESKPSAVTDGVVSDAKIPALPAEREVEATKASAAWPGVLMPLFVALIAAATVTLLFRRRPHLS